MTNADRVRKCFTDLRVNEFLQVKIFEKYWLYLSKSIKEYVLKLVK